MSEPAPAPIRFLVVDDNPEDLNSTVLLLAGAGFTVSQAASGGDVLAAIQQHQPDLLMLDHGLPGADGVSVCRRIKQDPALAAIFVIMVSSHFTASEEQSDGLESGADGCIARPISERQLLARAKAYVRILKLNRSLQTQLAKINSLSESTHESHLASLNLMEDAVAARNFTEAAYHNLQHEIAERRQAEEELRWKTALMEAQVHSSLDGILVVDKNGKKILQNQRMSDLWKIPPDIAEDKNDAVQVEFVIKRTRHPRQFAERVAYLYSHPHEISRDEIEVIDGTVLDRYSAPVRDQAGNQYGRIWSFRDITERKRMEASHARLAMSVEQSSENILITDTRGAILYANPAFERTTGYTVAEALGKNPRFLQSGKHEAGFFRQMWEVLARGEAWHGHMINRRKNGELFEEEATISPIRDEMGKVVNYVAVKRDVTREMRLEAQFRQSQTMESIGQLAGGIAHDFNNILAAIMMQVELAREIENTPEYVSQGLKAILASAERAASLTRQLLLFSRKQVMQPRQLDLNEVVTSLAKMLRRITGEDVRMELRFQTAPLMTFADPGMIDQVLMNLVVNARDAMPQGGLIIIETAEKTIGQEQAALDPEASPGRHAWFSVSDTGCGIPPEVVPRIFEPFFTTKEVGKGTGLGLAMVFGIVKQHHGWITVHSEVGRGTTFQVFLPGGNATAGDRTGKAAKTKPRGGSETILVAEDNEPLRILTGTVLKRAGYNVLEACDGVMAQQVWTEYQGRVDLLLTDLVMPNGVDGRELARLLRSQKAGLKVIFTSGYSVEIAGRELKLEAGQDFIQKPSDPDHLLEAIRNCLDGRSLSGN
jgi:PAS domain S-box-containing protein